MKIQAKIYQKANRDKWTLNYIDPKDKKRIRKSFSTKRAATLYLEELGSNLIQTRRTREGDKKNINSIIDEYTALYPRTLFMRVKLYVTLFKAEFGETTPKKITPTLLRDWMIKIRTEHNFSRSTLANLKGQIQVIFCYIKREGNVAASPLKKIRIRSRVDFYKRNKLSQVDMKKILEKLYYYSPYFLYRFFYVVYYSGITKMELVNLKREHVNYTERRVNIISSKAGFVRSVKIPDHVAEMLNGLPTRNEYLVSNRLGRKIDPNYIQRHLERFRIRYPDTPNFNAEDIRKTFAFHFLERGGSFKELSEIIGRSKLDDTVRLYGRPRKIFWSGEAATDDEISAADWGIQVID